MNNFPDKFTVIVKTALTEKQVKELIKLCIDHDVQFNVDILDKYVDNSNPSFYYNHIDGIERFDFDMEDVEDDEIFVTFDQFKAFIRGNGNLDLIPFCQEVNLGPEVAKVWKDKIVVGCKQFTHDALAELMKASQKAQKAKK